MFRLYLIFFSHEYKIADEIKLKIYIKRLLTEIVTNKDIYRSEDYISNEYIINIQNNNIEIINITNIIVKSIMLSSSCPSM